MAAVVNIIRRYLPQRLGAGAAGGTALALLAGGVAVASIPDSAGVFHGCVNISTGVIRLLPNSLSAPYNNCLTASVISANHLSPSLTEVAISWNQQGPKGDPGVPGANGTNGTNGTNGKDGTSVTSSSLGVGDTNCPSGGSAFSSISGMTYACNGTNGTNGTNGKDGTSFTDVSQLNGIACKTSDGSAGTLSVAVSDSNEVTLRCVPPAPTCTSPISHSAGPTGATYQDCAPLGTPGDPTTYTQLMAFEAGRSVLGGLTPVPLNCGSGSIDTLSFNGGAFWWTWQYAGSFAGHWNYESSTSVSGVCLGPSSPNLGTWN